MKKSLFDILRPRLPDAVFLDLFSGTGSVGLEALSGGASRAVFVEEDPRCARVIRDNLTKLGFQERGEVLEGEVLGWIGALRSRFDLVFLGPPYKSATGGPAAWTGLVLNGLAENGLLTQSGWIICQHHAKEAFDIPSGLTSFRAERYGDSRLTFVRLRSGGAE